jgi:hypothetical protein
MTRPLEWLAALNSSPGRPPPAQCHVLTVLALRLSWSAGTGFASVQLLADGAQVTEATARRALRWARRDGWLVQTRRGHRLGNDKNAASEWRLAIPSQAVTSDRLRVISSGQDGDLKRSETRSQAVTRDHPSRPSPSRVSTYSLSRAQLAQRAAAAGATEREINRIFRQMRDDRELKSWLHVLAYELDHDGPFTERLKRVREDLAAEDAGGSSEWCR